MSILFRNLGLKSGFFLLWRIIPGLSVDRWTVTVHNTFLSSSSPKNMFPCKGLRRELFCEAVNHFSSITIAVFFFKVWNSYHLNCKIAFIKHVAQDGGLKICCQNACFSDLRFWEACLWKTKVNSATTYYRWGNLELYVR